jgi:hypothetical protein
MWHALHIIQLRRGGVHARPAMVRCSQVEMQLALFHALRFLGEIA